MSIVNDALKKAGREFELGDQKTAPPVQKAASGSDKKWITMIGVSLVIIASLFGSLILYKNISGFNLGYAPGESGKSSSAIQSTLNNIERKTAARPMKPQDAVRLNGIVYGGEDRWAIVNDRIVREGDMLLGGEITSITKDIVKIKKSNGSEITLSLK